MLITSRDEWKSSRKISSALAAKLRAGTATEQEEAEYRFRDKAEDVWSRANARPFKWGQQFGGKTCEELGLMP